MITRSASELQAAARRTRSDAALAGLRKSAATTQARAEALASRRVRELIRIERRLKDLSSKRGTERPNLTAGEHEERLRLLAARGRLEGERQTAAQAATAASATYTAISNQRRQDLDARWLARTSSPLERDFWTGLSEAADADTTRARAVAEEAWRTASVAPEPQGLLTLLAAMVFAVLLVWPARRGLLHLMRRHPDEAGAGDFRRFAHALAVVLIDTALPAAAAVCVELALGWGRLLSPKAGDLVQAAVIAVVWGAAVVALARQLVGARGLAGGLVATPRRLAVRMRTLPWLVAVITGAGFLLSRLNSVVGASLAATIAVNCVVSLAYAGVASLVLVALGADSRSDEREAQTRTPAPGLALLSILLTAAVALTVAAVFTGYTTFAEVASSQLFWVSVLGAATWLLLRFVDELCVLMFEPHGWMGRLLTGLVNLPGRTSQQLGALTSALLQVLIVLGALGLALTPFGRNGEVLTAHLNGFGASLRFGALVVSPQAIGLGVAVLGVGLLLARIVQRWIDRRFLPLTDWDIGVRASISTCIRYLTISAAVLWALAGMGLGFKQIALVAGALSVGIGFGLQQIVQNFVSGLILLVERPVKVGDWISLAGVEGDVRRIRVRATEIRLFDQSTLIVPNSDLITKQVENKTLGTERARLKLQVTIGAAADASKAIKAIGEVLEASEQTLDEPRPGVFIDSLSPAGAVTINAFAHVGSARDAYRVRSRLYLEIIEALGLAEVAFVGAEDQKVTLQPSDILLRLLEANKDALSIVRKS